ncbi:MAG TPA: hypothetical protein DCZ05_13450 [Deltaproteobacteria bacterium]|nr:hypothetical protein [Deltaproteobacteria bacterium]
MLELAIPVDIDRRGNTIVETNSGRELTAPGWPQDCEFQLVAFHPSSRSCEVVWIEQLAEDIANALELLNTAGIHRDANTDWYQRLVHYCNGVGLRRPPDSQD